MQDFTDIDWIDWIPFVVIIISLLTTIVLWRSQIKEKTRQEEEMI